MNHCLVVLGLFLGVCTILLDQLVNEVTIATSRCEVDGLNTHDVVSVLCKLKFNRRVVIQLTR